MKKAIYKITNKINQKIYIGQSSNPEQRFLQHCYKHEKYISLINKAILKYGKENFDFVIIGWFEDYNEKEKYYIEYFGSMVPNGYNLSKGGEKPPIGTHRTINKEIAEQLNIAETTVKTQVQRAYRMLRERLVPIFLLIEYLLQGF